MPCFSFALKRLATLLSAAALLSQPSRFVEIDPTRFRCFINTLLITVTIKTTGAPRIFKSFAELQLHHAKILAYDEANLDKHCYEYFRAIMPGVSELRRAAHIDGCGAISRGCRRAACALVPYAMMDYDGWLSEEGENPMR